MCDEIEITWSDEETRIIHEMAQMYERGDQSVNIKEFCKAMGIESTDVWNNAFKRLWHFELIKPSSNVSMEALPRCVVISQEMRKPTPPRNYLREWTTWWFDSQLRSAITVVGIFLPLIVQWVEMIQTVLAWVLN